VEGVCGEASCVLLVKESAGEAGAELGVVSDGRCQARGIGGDQRKCRGPVDLRSEQGASVYRGC